MTPLTHFVCCLLLVSTPLLASPAPSGIPRSPAFDPAGLVCKIPIVNNILCLRQGGSTGPSVRTSMGTATGVLDPSGALRFAVRYGSALRWKPSSVVGEWQLPNGGSHPSAMPLLCPQPNVADSAMTEDCLSMILYVPKDLQVKSGVSTMVWIHGESFVAGGATDPGLNGSKLAAATGCIVAVVQYRLGALGFLGPDGSTNLGLKDIVTALQFLKEVIPSLGGESSKVTVAGQSSGANMIRALLAVPSASSLFQSAILQSDPMDYGFLAPSVQQKLQSAFNSDINCGGTDSTCLNVLSVDQILTAQNNIFNNAFTTIDPSTSQSEPIRVVHDGSFITSPLDSTAPFPQVSKPLLISNVLNEAGFAIYNSFAYPLPENELDFIVNLTFGSPRTQEIMNSGRYSPPPGVDPATFDARIQLQLMGTDYLWKCAGWTFARNWVQNGGRVFVGMYTVGATYPVNGGVPFCTDNGVVCHQDDIEIVFGTVPNPSAAQSKLITEMQARYKAFLTTGNPNPAGSSFANWVPATTTDVHALTLGGSGEVVVGACDPSFWGQAVQYDYQVYNI